MNSGDQPATKGDVEEIVTRVVTKATSEILTAVGEQLNTVNDQIDEVEDNLGSKIDKLELKVNNVTDDHEIRISKLEKQPI
ncbi:MAG: hypothetical protein AAB541_03770 [Patescibacteria group bacterium]